MLKRWMLILSCQSAATPTFWSKLRCADRLRRLWHLLLIFHSSLLNTSSSCTSWGHLGRCGSCFSRLFNFLIFWCDCSSGGWLIIPFLSGVEHVLRCSRHIIKTSTRTSGNILIMCTYHRMKCGCVRFGKVFVEGHRFLSCLILRKGWSCVISSRSGGLTLARLGGHLTVTIEGRGQCSAILSKSAISMETNLAATTDIKEASACFGRQGTSEILFSARWSGRCVSSRPTTLWWMWRRMRWHDEERRWRLLDLLIRFIDTLNEWIDQFVGGAMR